METAGLSPERVHKLPALSKIGGNKMYFRSTATGQCYKLDFIPQFGGYELITEEEFLAWCKANRI